MEQGLAILAFFIILLLLFVLFCILFYETEISQVFSPRDRIHGVI